MKKLPVMALSSVVKSILLFIIAAGWFQSLHAQTEAMGTKVYIAKIYTPKETVKGILYSVDDSSISIYPDSLDINKYHLSTIASSTKEYSYRDIEMVKINKRGSYAKGIAIGASTGLILGLVIDAATQSAANTTLNTVNSLMGSNTPAEEAGFSPVATITCTILGGLIGTGTAALSAKMISINKNPSTFAANKYLLNSYALKK